MAFLRKAELVGESKRAWMVHPRQWKDGILELPYVARFEGTSFFFTDGQEISPIKEEFEKNLSRILECTVSVKYSFHPERPDKLLAKALSRPDKFANVSFGSDVAEDDNHLMAYFLSTDAFKKAVSGEKALFIGPKGNGKSAILRALRTAPSSGYSIVITPEVFATSSLSQFESSSNDEQAFISTWIFTILFEVFKRVNANPRGIPPKTLEPIRNFVSENDSFVDMNIFTRWISYLKSIKSIESGDLEISARTRRLQEAYNLEKLYSLVPQLRKAIKEDILILIDELDQGWDNSPRMNKFIAALLHAAIRIKRLQLPIRVIVMIRSEIYNLVKFELDQLDKLRSSIEHLKWTDGGLATLLLKRIGFSCGIPQNIIDQFDATSIRHFFSEACGGMSGFEYLVSRTTRRPREVLQYARHAHATAKALGRGTITASTLEKAEEEFSAWKFEHMCSEYMYIYPKLHELLTNFRAQGPILSRLDVESIINDSKSGSDGEVPAWLNAESSTIVQMLFNIEFLGARRVTKKSVPGLLSQYQFSYDGPADNATNVRRCEAFLVHPALWRCLEIERIGP